MRSGTPEGSHPSHFFPLAPGCTLLKKETFALSFPLFLLLPSFLLLSLLLLFYLYLCSRFFALTPLLKLYPSKRKEMPISLLFSQQKPHRHFFIHSFILHPTQHHSQGNPLIHTFYSSICPILSLLSFFSLSTSASLIL